MNRIKTPDYNGNDRRRSVVDRLGKAPLVVVGLFVVLAVLVFAIASTNSNAARFAQLSAERQADTKTQSEFNAKLLEIVQEFNEAHAKASGENSDNIIQNQKCFTDYFLDFFNKTNAGQPAPDKAILDACFKPLSPQPTPPEQPKSPSDRQGKR